MTTTTTTRSISAADTAKLVRKALKALWPAVKFSVRTSTYSGGASIDVGWTDGPTPKEVEAITSRFEGASFDGMIDLKTHHTTEYQGERVHFMADYIFTNRKHGVAAYQAAVDRLAERYGVAAPAVLVSSYDGGPYCDPAHPTTGVLLRGRYNFSELVSAVLDGSDIVMGLFA